ncbi:MAG: PKD domain-containing protein [Candidatus Aminicenantes bacterium]|nr:PKD domain-containing protein [Candidatus Aminicenantes bacterium]
MKKMKIFVLIFLLAFAFSLVGQESKPKKLIEGEVLITRLSKDSAGFRSHSIFAVPVVFEENGEEKVMVCWSEETGLKNIYYTKKKNNPTAEWMVPGKASNTWCNSKTPHLAVDPNKPTIVHMCWADGETRHSKDIWHTRYFDGAWGHGMTWINCHPFKNNDSFPWVSILSDGTINCVWEFMVPNPVSKQYDNTYLRNINNWTIDNEQIAWSREGHGVSTNKIHHATHITIASRGMKSYAAWQQGESGHRVVMFSEKNQLEDKDAHWAWPIQISADNHSFWPKITVDSKDNVHVMWGQLRGKYGYRARIFGEWEPMTNINKGRGSRTFFDIQADDTNDMVHAVFRGDGIHLYYSAKSIGNLNAWAQEVQFTEICRDCSHADLFVDTHGQVHVGYSDIPAGASHSRDIVYATFKAPSEDINIAAGEFPKADFTMNIDSTTVVEGSSVTFDASPSSSPGGNISAYYWNFNDFNNPDHYDFDKMKGKSITHTFEKEGFYTATLSVLDSSKGLIGTKKVTLEVISGPLPPLSATVDDFLNRGFVYRDWINLLNWEENPQNTALGFTIDSYNLYRRQAGTEAEWTPLATVSGTTFSYYDKGFTTQPDTAYYQYGISLTADVGGNSMESTITLATRVDNI